METFVVARRDRIARRADIAVMHQQVFGRGNANRAPWPAANRPASVRPVFLVHQLVAVVDPDRAGDHADAEEQRRACSSVVRCAACGDVPDQAEQRDELHRRPDQVISRYQNRSSSVACRSAFSVFRPTSASRAENRYHRDQRQQQHRPAAVTRADPGQRHKHERHPERQRALKVADLGRRDDLMRSSGYVWLTGVFARAYRKRHPAHKLTLRLAHQIKSLAHHGGQIGGAKVAAWHETARYRGRASCGHDGGNQPSGSRWKCVKVWRTSAGQLLPVAKAGWIGSGAGSPWSTQSGTGPAQHSAQKSLVRAAFPTATPRPSAAPDRAMPCRVGLGFFGVFRAGRRPSPFDARGKASRHGQIPQAGDFGVQIVAPRSITACA